MFPYSPRFSGGKAISYPTRQVHQAFVHAACRLNAKHQIQFAPFDGACLRTARRFTGGNKGEKNPQPGSPGLVASIHAAE